MAPLELYQKIYVAPSFLETDHGGILCQECHGGNPDDDNWQTAHTGIVKDPSFLDADRVCGECHEEIVESAVKSLHYTLKPMFDAVFLRAGNSGKSNRHILKKSMDKHCGTCHSSCGQCHVSRPDYVRGGFLSKHHFKKTPPMNTSCASCHGGRIHGEFVGVNEDYAPDTHFEDQEMECTACHTSGHMHASAENIKDRNDAAFRPDCESCHAEIVSEASENKAHAIHGKKVSCRVCHCQSYKNCFSCHVGTDKKGIPYYKCDSTQTLFKIGLNPLKTKSIPYDFVLLRHVPAAPDTFKYYTLNTLKNFNNLPTWKPAAPHNILKTTPQNQACNNCHGNPLLFLQNTDLEPYEKIANQKVVVPLTRIPKKVLESKK